MSAHPNNFDFVRLVAASLVIWGHAYPLLDEPGLPAFMGSSIHTLAVKVFFVVSGYLIVASWVRDPDPLRYTMKRGLRILPALFVVVMLSAFVLGPLVTTLPLGDYFSSPVLVSYFKNILLNIRYFLPGVFDGNIYPSAVNGSLWTLPVEATMYFFVLLLGVATLWSSQQFFKFGWLLLTLVFLTTVAVRTFFMPELFQGLIVQGMLVTAFLDVTPYFMVGGCLFLFSRVIPQSLPVALILVAGSYLLQGTFAALSLLNIVILSYAVVAFGNSSTPFIRRAGRFGDMSYGVYLYGFPVAQTLSWAFGRNMPFVAHILWTLVISLGFAFASWHLIEKRALSLKGVFSRSRQPAN